MKDLFHSLISRNICLPSSDNFLALQPRISKVRLAYNHLSKQICGRTAPHTKKMLNEPRLWVSESNATENVSKDSSKLNCMCLNFTPDHRYGKTIVSTKVHVSAVLLHNEFSSARSEIVNYDFARDFQSYNSLAAKATQTIYTRRTVSGIPWIQLFELTQYDAVFIRSAGHRHPEMTATDTYGPILTDSAAPAQAKSREQDCGC